MSLEKTIKEYQKFVVKLPSAFCPIDYALYIINVILYSISDLR
jgi:hypothetical protein